MHDDVWVVEGRDEHCLSSATGWSSADTESPRFETQAEAIAYRLHLIDTECWEPKRIRIARRQR